MMIKEYAVEPINMNVVEMHAGASVLAAGSANNRVVVYAQVDTENPIEARRFLVCDAGERLPKDVVSYSKYVGSTELFNRTKHIYEVRVWM